MVRYKLNCGLKKARDFLQLL